MSDSSRNSNSGGSAKGLIGRKGISFNGAGAADALKKGLGHFTGMTKNVGNSLQNMFNNRKGSSVYTPGVCELDKNGYEKYNIDDTSEIFISKTPDSALFDDGTLFVVNGSRGEFVGSNVSTPQSSVGVDVGAVQEASDVTKTLFKNVETGTSDGVNIQVTIGEVVDGTVRPTPTVDFNRMKHVEVVNHVGGVEFIDDEASSNEFMADEIPQNEVSQVVEEALDDMIEPFDASGSEPIQIDDEPDIVPVVESVDVFQHDVDGIATEPVMSNEPSVDETEIWHTPEDVPHSAFVDEASVTVEESTMMVEGITGIESEPVSAAGSENEEADTDYEYELVMDVDNEAEEILSQHKDEIEAAMEEYKSEQGSTSVVEAQPKVQSFGFVEAPEEAPVDEIAVVPETSSVTSFIEASTAPAEECVGAFEEESIETVEPVEESAKMDEPVVAAATLPSALEGLMLEGDAPSSDVGSVGIAKIAGSEMAETSASGTIQKDSVKLPTTKMTGLDDVEIIEPTVRRPKSFRFKNGVLQTVNNTEEKESDEGLRNPFELTVGETVTPDAVSGSEPAVEITDEVGDLMRLTVPELDVDEDSSVFRFEYDPLPEDDMERICYEMMITEESVQQASAESVCMSVPEVVPALPSAPVMLSLPVSAPVMLSAPAEADAEHVAPAPVVTFSFGNGTGADDSVCFIF